jgi:hypothetical protein
MTAAKNTTVSRPIIVDAVWLESTSAMSSFSCRRAPISPGQRCAKNPTGSRSTCAR